MARFLRSGFLFIVYILLFVGSLSLIYRDSFRKQLSPSQPKEGETGVIFYDHWRAFDGYNVANTYFEQPSCVVYTMSGDVVFRFPGGFCHFLESGEFFTTTDQIQFYNPSGRVEWKVDEEFIHHDVHLSYNENEIFVLTADTRLENGQRAKYDSVRGYSLKGEKIFDWRVVDYYEDVKKTILALSGPKTVLEGTSLTQLNSVQVVPPNSLEDVIPAFQRGNILVSDSLRSIAFIIDRTNKKILWSMNLSGKNWQGVNSVRILANGNFFFFSNRNEDENHEIYSSIKEMNPQTKEIVWEYHPKEKNRLYMADGGAAYRLTNGNTLVTHSTHGGGAFEITKAGRLVWEWIYPVQNKAGQAESVYQVKRVSKARVDNFLKVWRMD